MNTQKLNGMMRTFGYEYTQPRLEECQKYTMCRLLKYREIVSGLVFSVILTKMVARSSGSEEQILAKILKEPKSSQFPIWIAIGDVNGSCNSNIDPDIANSPVQQRS